MSTNEILSGALRSLTSRCHRGGTSRRGRVYRVSLACVVREAWWCGIVSRRSACVRVYVVSRDRRRRGCVLSGRVRSVVPESCWDVSLRASSMWAPGKRHPPPSAIDPDRGGCGFRLSARLRSVIDDTHLGQTHRER